LTRPIKSKCVSCVLNLSLFEPSSQSELQKQKRETEQLSDRLAVLEKEGQALGASLASSQRECTEQRLEHQALLAWKAEKEALIDQTEAVQGVLRENISRLESAISQLNKDHDELKVRTAAWSLTDIHGAGAILTAGGETSVFQGQLNGVEAQRAGLSAQIDSLKGELLNKSTELEVRERQYEDAQAQLSEAGQKHAKDLDNIGVQVALLQEQVG
jgi:chromosome segregation ATPase